MLAHTNRKTIRLQEYDYTFPGWYYITICTDERKNLFGIITNGKMIHNRAGNILEEEWIRTKEIRKNIDLDYYVIMPNHLHGIIIINSRGESNSPQDKTGRMQYAPTNVKFKSPSQSLGAIVRGFKSAVTKRLREISGNPELKIWQRNYYEHIIRNDLDLHNIRQYIENNPLKWEIDEYYYL
ncbi:MAG: hypothetical protein A2V50_01945 [Bacteroidetes bacterium RBG_19FT_COMBO_42_10]|nr:MAG: hypothetical protein A2V50_01945 [Bacteroidetes bacterium RBG_19FT_COMBO_42_10]